MVSSPPRRPGPTGASTRAELIRLAAEGAPLPSPVEAYFEVATALRRYVAPFTDAPFVSVRLGNYVEDGVEAVWHGAAYQRFLEQLYSSEPPTSCRNCGLAWSL